MSSDEASFQSTTSGTAALSFNFQESSPFQILRLRRCSSTFSKPRSEWLKWAINAAAANYRLIWIVGRVVRRKWFYWTASQPIQPQTPSIGKWPVVDSPEPHNISRRIQHNKTTTFYAIISHHNCSAIKLLKPGSASCDLRLSFAKMPGEKFTRKISWDDSSVSVNWLLLSHRIYEICFLSLFFSESKFSPFELMSSLMMMGVRRKWD